MSMLTIILVGLVGVVVVGILAQIKLKLIYTEDEKYLLISYLFFKKKFNLQEQMKQVEEEIEQQAKQFFESLNDIEPQNQEILHQIKDNKSEKSDKKKSVKQSNQTKITKQKENNNVKVNKAKTKISKEEPTLFEKIDNYLQIFTRSKLIIQRFAKRLNVQTLNVFLVANVDDPMLNAMVYASLWTGLSTCLSFVNQYVKKIEQCKYDVSTQFSGNNFFAQLECIVTVRIVDIIIVGILSIKDIRQIIVKLK